MRRWIPLLFLLFLPVWGAELETARSLIEQRRLDEAVAVLERSIEDPQLEGQALLLLTQIANQREAYEDGIRYGKRVVALLPESSEAHLSYAQALRIKMSKVNKMKAMFSLSSYKSELARALELDPNNLDALEERVGFLTQAPGFAGGDLEAASETIETLRKLDRERGLMMEAQLEFKKGNEKRAVEIWTAALEERPDNHGLRLQLAYWYQSNERWKDADREFAKLAEGPDTLVVLSALYQRARTRILGEYDQRRAIEMLQEYVGRLEDPSARLPSRSAAWWRMGNAWEQLGDEDAARRSYREALNLDPENKEAKKALKALR